MNDSSDMSIAHLLSISMDNVKAAFDLTENKFNALIEQRDAAIARAETSESALDAARMVCEQALEAFRLTQEYVTPEVLPSLPGWSHHDATLALREFLFHSTIPTEENVNV